MADRPILFSAPMIGALLSGAKSQTRRLLANPEYYGCPTGDCPHDRQEECNRAMNESTADDLRFRVGDRLWCKETWRSLQKWDGIKPSLLMDDPDKIDYAADGFPRNRLWAWGKTRVSIFMPRWASRLTLVVTDVRVERLNDCSEADALAEGVVPHPNGGFWVPGVDHPNKDFPYLSRATAREMYAALWDVINGSGAWIGNPWVVAVSFAVHHCNIDQMEADNGIR